MAVSACHYGPSRSTKPQSVLRGHYVDQGAHTGREKTRRRINRLDRRSGRLEPAQHDLELARSDEIPNLIAERAREPAARPRVFDRNLAAVRRQRRPDPDAQLAPVLLETPVGHAGEARKQDRAVMRQFLRALRPAAAMEVLG